MKKTKLSSCSSALVLAAGLFAAALPAAGQSILININQADPTTVSFLTTGVFSFTNNSTVYNLVGVDLISYFTSAPAVVEGTVNGNFIPAGTSSRYTQWIPDNLNVATSVDLNLYTTTSPHLQGFSTASPAFLGGGTIDLSSLLAFLPSTGTSGNIYSGNAHSPGVLIGRWVVVPEPSVEAQLALGATVLAGLALFRRSRRAAVRG